jgi:hypothetical protein
LEWRGWIVQSEEKPEVGRVWSLAKIDMSDFDVR